MAEQSKQPKTSVSLAEETALMTQEQLMPVRNKKGQLTIGLPVETELQENRIGLTPDAVKVLVANGNKVQLEATAGNASKFSDHDYSEAGAQIVYDTEEVFQSDILLKVEPPNEQELEYIKPGGILISALPMSRQDADYIKNLQKKRITAIAYDYIQDQVESLPIVRAMSEIAGSTVLLIAAEYLNSASNGKGIILGGVTGVPPTKVVILGAGTVSEYAARTAIGLGAEVKIFDNSPYKLRRLKEQLGMSLYTSTIESVELEDALMRADVVIGALRAEDGRSPCVVTEDQVAAMKPNSAIIDVSIDQGGCFETSEVTTHEHPIFKRYDIIHYCVPNIPSRVARTASRALSNIFTPLFLKAQDRGGIESLIYSHDGFAQGVYLFKGTLTHKGIANRLGMNYKDMSLLRAAGV